MTPLTYAEKLKDPRWQKKRLEVLQRDRWTCKLCNDTHTTLHVHHLSYAENPWDVALDELLTYCKHCHAIIEFNKQEEVVRPVMVTKSEYDGGVKLLFLYYDSESQDYVDIYFYKNEKLKYLTSLSGITIDCIYRQFRFINELS